MSDPEALNVYGDRLVATTGVHGADIASQRMDDLDRACLAYARGQDKATAFAVDLGCGLGTQGLRLARLGLNTLLIDRLDLADGRATMEPQRVGSGKLNVLVKDVRQLVPSDFAVAPTLVFSQRFLHYLRFAEASSLVSILARSMASGAPLFISASGLHSELGQGYADRARPIARRCCRLEARIARKHQIREPVCLYTERDLKALVTPFGFAEIRVWSSTFGNIKAIFVKK